MTDMMDSKTTRTATVVLCFMGCLALGLTFTRDGTGNYNDEAKWDYEGGFCYASPYCYPHTTNDDAIVDTVVDIDFTEENEEIDDLTISGRQCPYVTTFSGQDYERTLDCDTITFTDTLVRVIRKGRLEARGTEPCPEET